MDSFIQDRIDSHIESIKEKEFRAECHEQKRKLQEMEAILWPLPHLWRELAEMANDPEAYILKNEKCP